MKNLVAVALLIVVSTSALVKADQYNEITVYTDHPMGEYLNKEGRMVFKLFGNPNLCKPWDNFISRAEAKANGEEAVLENQKLACERELTKKNHSASRYGISFSDDDFKSESYRAAYNKALNEEKLYIASIPFGFEGINQKVEFNKKQKQTLSAFKLSGKQ